MTITGFIAALFVPSVAGCSVHKAAINDFHRHSGLCRLLQDYCFILNMYINQETHSSVCVESTCILQYHVRSSTTCRSSPCMAVSPLLRTLAKHLSYHLQCHNWDQVQMMICYSYCMHGPTPRTATLRQASLFTLVHI